MRPFSRPASHSQGRPHLVDELQQQGHRPPCQKNATAVPQFFFLHCLTKSCRLHTNGHVHDHPELHRGISGLGTVCTVRPHCLARSTTQGMDNLSKNCTCGSPQVLHCLAIGTRHHNDGHANLIQKTAPVESPRFPNSNGRNNLSKNCSCGISTGWHPGGGSGDAKPLTPCPQYILPAPENRQGHPGRVQGMPSPWTQTSQPTPHCTTLSLGGAQTHGVRMCTAIHAGKCRQ